MRSTQLYLFISMFEEVLCALSIVLEKALNLYIVDQKTIINMTKNENYLHFLISIYTDLNFTANYGKISRDTIPLNIVNQSE